MTTAFTQESDFRKEREFGQKISATFEFIGAHWRPLGRVMLYTVLPAALLQGVVNTTMQLTIFRNLQASQTEMADSKGLQMLTNMGMMASSPLYWLNMVLSLAFISLVVLSVYGYLLCCLRRPSHQEYGGLAAATDYSGVTADVTVADVWAVIRQEFVSSFFSIIGIYLVVIIGLLLFVLPGMYLSVMVSLFFVVKLVEGTGFGATLSRCRQLISGKWWSTFGLMLVMLLLLYSLFLLVGLVTSAFGNRAVGLIQSGALQSPAFVIIVNTMSTIIMLLFYPPLLIVLAFQYFNLVERRDGVGLRSLVGQLGQAAPTARNASYRPDEEGEY